MSTTFKSILTNDEVVNLSVMLFLAGKVIQSGKTQWIYFDPYIIIVEIFEENKHTLIMYIRQANLAIYNN